MRRMAILTYHSLDDSGSVISTSPRVFKRQLALLKQHGYRGVTLSAALNERQALGHWPERTVALTFDDGFQNLHSVALQALAEHGFAATVYLVSDYVGRSHSWETPPSGLNVQPILTWPQVGDLLKAGWEVGSHTLSHPDLRALGEVQLEREIVASQDELVARVGQPIQSFAFPYGHVSAAAEAVVARHYSSAVTTVLKHATVEASSLLPRIDTYYFQDPERFERLLTSGQRSYLALRRWGRRVKAFL